MRFAVTVHMLARGHKFVRGPNDVDVYEVTAVICDPEGHRDLNKIEAVLLSNKNKKISVMGNDTVWKDED